MSTYNIQEVNKRLRSLGAKELSIHGKEANTIYEGIKIQGIPLVTGSKTKIDGRGLEYIARKMSHIGEMKSLFHGGQCRFYENVLKGKRKAGKSPLKVLARAHKYVDDILVFLIFFTSIMIFSGDITGFAVLTDIGKKTIGFNSLMIFVSLLIFIKSLNIKK